MIREELCNSLITWLKTFNLEPQGDTIDELSDGVLLSKVLNAISPTFFDEAWMSKLKADSATNWRIKTSNLKKVLKGILDYYADVLGQQIQDFHMPDVTLIGEKHDAVEMSRLLQLVLGCAVNCEDKQEYIQSIMSMEEEVQHMVMQAIQELMTKESPAAQKDAAASAELVEQLKKAVEDLNSVMEEKDEIAQRCHELDSQIAALQEEKSSLEVENERLNERIHQADSLDDPSTPAGRRFQQLQNQVEQQQEEIYRIESEKEDYRIKVELKEKEMLELHQKNDDLTALAEEARNLKDENDVLRHTADKVSKYEMSIDTLKKKLEGKSDLDGQIKILEEKNTTLIQTNMEFEEEVRKMGTVKSQLDLYKRQVQELQSKYSDETKRADKAEFESKRTGEKMQTVQREKEKLKEENISLSDTIDELRGTRAQQEIVENSILSQTSVTSPDNLQGEGGNLDESGLMGLSLPPEVKERIIRLQHENKMLKLQKSSSEDENAQLLQTLLDDSNSRNNELETEVRILNQRILELSAQVEDLQESQEKSSQATDSSGAQLRKTLNEQLQKNKQLSTALHQKQTALEDLEPALGAKEEKITRLEACLADKEKEMKHMEEKYKRYLEKAKAVIHSLNPKQNAGTEPEVQALRNQLSEKDRFIEHLEKEQDKSKSIRDQEEKLMVTAWYNLGMKLHRKASEERLVSSAGGQSFLARQRQAQTRRTASLNTSPHITAMAGAR